MGHNFIVIEICASHERGLGFHPENSLSIDIFTVKINKTVYLILGEVARRFVKQFCSWTEPPIKELDLT